MTDKQKTGGPAFPCDRIITENQGLACATGMTLRDYFAAKVLPAVYKDYCEAARVDGWDTDWRHGVAEDSYEIADAMLRARETA